MFVELSSGITLYPGTFTAVIAPRKFIIAALGNNGELQRFHSCFVCGSVSCLLPSISCAAPHFEMCISMSAAQFLERVQDAHYSIIIFEHDPSLFDGTEQMSAPISAALRDLGNEALVILFAEVKDPSFFALARYADRFIELIPPDEQPNRHAYSGTRVYCGSSHLHCAQTLLEVS
jgi:hypothetical protein